MGKTIKSFRDSQGFRIHPNQKAYTNGSEGKKLNVLKVNASIYHYSYARNPSLMKKKDTYFKRFWHTDQQVKAHKNKNAFNFNEIDALEPFTMSHPKYMKQVMAEKDWNFEYDPEQSNMRLKDRFLFWLEKKTGKRFFEYKNYTLIKP